MKKILLVLVAATLLLSGCGKDEVVVADPFTETVELVDMVYPYNPVTTFVEKETRQNITVIKLTTPDRKALYSGDILAIDKSTVGEKQVAYKIVGDYKIGIYLGLEEGTAVYKIYLLPNAVVEDNIGYMHTLRFNQDVQPIDDILESIKRGVNAKVGAEVVTITYNELYALLSDVYNKSIAQSNALFQGDVKTNKDGLVSTGDSNQKYEPKLQKGCYVLDGKDFTYIQVGTNSNQLKSGTYEVKWRSGTGIVGKTDEFMVAKQSFLVEQGMDQKVLKLEKGERLIVTDGLEIVLEKK